MSISELGSASEHRAMMLQKGNSAVSVVAFWKKPSPTQASADDVCLFVGVWQRICSKLVALLQRSDTSSQVYHLV
jgi:hypothetical protein